MPICAPRTPPVGRAVAAAALVLCGCTAADGDNKPPPPQTSVPEATTPAPDPPPDADAPAEDPRIHLSDLDRLARISMALRGLRPSPEEIDAIVADPDAIEGIVDDYLDSDAFGETIRDMHAELFLVRTDVERRFPALGTLAGLPPLDIDSSAMEGPLVGIEAIVREDRPYTEIVTADEIWVDDVSARVWGVPYDPSGPPWQASAWTDGRPAAGLLVDSALFVRHQSAGGNANRGRAEMLSNALLCQSFLDRDVTLDGTVDLADETAVADAVQTNAGCVGCHQALDPLAALLWQHYPTLDPQRIAAGCDGPGGPGGVSSCYPLQTWTPPLENAWETFGLRAPGFYGLATDDLAHLGHQIAADPRFSLCTARRFYGYLTQTDPADVPFEIAADLQRTFLDSGASARTLVRDIVLSEAFGAVSTPDPEQWPAVSLGFGGSCFFGRFRLLGCRFFLGGGWLFSRHFLGRGLFGAGRFCGRFLLSDRFFCGRLLAGSFLGHESFGVTN